MRTPMPAILTLQILMSPTTSAHPCVSNFSVAQLEGADAITAIDIGAEVGFVFIAQVLNDPIHFDVCIGHRAQDLMEDTWLGI